MLCHAEVLFGLNIFNIMAYMIEVEISFAEIYSIIIRICILLL